VTRTAHWNNESTPLRVWVAGAEGWTIASQLLEAPQCNEPESEERLAAVDHQERGEL
jgi:hypothetical protein